MIDSNIVTAPMIHNIMYWIKPSLTWNGLLTCSCSCIEKCYCLSIFLCDGWGRESETYSSILVKVHGFGLAVYCICIDK